MLTYISISPQEAMDLVDWVRQSRPRRILEVGAFVGVSSAVLALSAGEDSLLVTVDPGFPVTVEGQRFGCVEYRPSRYFRGLVHRHFNTASRVKEVPGYYSCVPCAGTLAGPRQLGVDVEAIPVVGQFAEVFGPFDMVFIDGDHYATSVHSDLQLVASQLAAGGTIFLHDFIGNWQDEVRAGTERFLESFSEFASSDYGSLGRIHRKQAVE